MTTTTNQTKDPKRRDFLGMALGSFGALGAIASLVAMKRSWDPLPSVVSAGFTTIDISSMKEGDFAQNQWRGKPVYIIRKKNDSTINPARDFKIGDGIYTMGIQICTHLGCIPIFQADNLSFLCPCHGGRFTEDGVNIAGTPPPRPFDIPPFKVDGTKLTLGATGSEYEAMLSQAKG
ncbi:MAG: ubiquinol-cytochrome c reductase iron-sulfur subunit [Helicobacter sp.]|nr:ubiquinol-cytochrome c reductase iron-sulfur subunit [Helicobacter sp.]